MMLSLKWIVFVSCSQVSAAWQQPSGLEGFHDPFHGGGMTLPEKVELAGYYADAHSVFEWGIGSSTLIAAHTGVDKLVAVDSSSEWVHRVQLELNASKYYIKAEKYELHYVNIGATMRWGIPIDEATRPQWPQYSKQADILSTKPFDVYLVDGRFRIACVARALLHGHQHSVVIVHDATRPEYGMLNNVAEKIKQVGTLLVLRRKKGVTRDKLERVWRMHALLPTSGGHLDVKMRRLGHVAEPSGISTKLHMDATRNRLRVHSRTTSRSIASLGLVRTLARTIGSNIVGEMLTTHGVQFNVLSIALISFVLWLFMRRYRSRYTPLRTDSTLGTLGEVTTKPSLEFFAIPWNTQERKDHVSPRTTDRDNNPHG